MLNIQLLLTGNELMSGDIVDSNSAMMAHKLANLGLSIYKKTTVADDFDQLVDEIEKISHSADLLIINGGLGPTVDDLTAQALAKAAKIKITQHPEALAHIKQWCKQRNYALNKPNLKQAELPHGCDIVANRVGSAVGFSLNLNGCHIFCTPGVPKELDIMLEEQILPEIEAELPEQAQYHVSRFQVFGIGESSLQKIINESFSDWPTEIELGFRASMPILELKLTTKTAQDKILKQIWINKLKAKIGDHWVGEITDQPMSLAEHLSQQLIAQHKKITVAESCTGGMLASALTKVSGISQAFEAGFVTYSNEMKTKILNVSKDSLIHYGAVSEQTVTEMAQGALDISQADIAVAVSGVAGPSGGSEDKPVGTVWIAWGTKEKIQTVCLYLPGSRFYFQHYTTAICLDLARRLLINSQDVPSYIKERQKS